MPSPELIRLIDGTQQPATCRGCGAAIYFFETLSNRRMPMRASAVPQRVQPDPASGRVIGFYAASDAHWVDCPAAASFGRKGRSHGATSTPE